MIFDINDLTQIEACTVDDPTNNGNLHVALYNEDRTVALMIMEENGGISGGKTWRSDDWGRLPNVNRPPFFEIKLVMGQNLGGTPCSDEPQTEQVDQIFVPTVAPSSVQSVVGGLGYPMVIKI